LVQDTQGISGDYVHNNTIILAAAAGDDHGMTGIAGANSAMRFDYDTFYVHDPSASHWQWSSDMTWAQFRALGNEAHGQLIVSDVVAEPCIGELAGVLLVLTPLIAVFCRWSVPQKQL
jgi:hypothetical protein